MPLLLAARWVGIDRRYLSRGIQAVEFPQQYEIVYSYIQCVLAVRGLGTIRLEEHGYIFMIHKVYIQ